MPMTSSRGPVAGRTLRLPCLIVSCVISSPAAWGQQAPPEAAPPPGAAGGIGKAKLAENPVNVLGGRLTVRMPRGARVEPRPFPIMAAPESEQHETRVLFDVGEEQLSLMAEESFAFAGDDLVKDVKGWVAKWKGKYKVEPLPLPAKGLRAVVVIPADEPDHTRSDDATFVEGLFVESADRTIQSLDVYVNPAGENDLKGCKAVARQILLSAAPGKASLPLAAGERRLYAYAKDLEISVTVPKDTVATLQVGPDFLVHRLIALGRLGSNAGSILIYVGDHPDYKPGAKKGEGMMFGKKVEWHTFPQKDGLQALCELPIPSEDHLNAHVIIRAPTDAQLKGLQAAAESLKLVKAKGPPPR